MPGLAKGDLKVILAIAEQTDPTSEACEEQQCRKTKERLRKTK